MEFTTPFRFLIRLDTFAPLKPTVRRRRLIERRPTMHRTVARSSRITSESGLNTFPPLPGVFITAGSWVRLRLFDMV